jgi:hypothetical protein
MNLGRTCKVVLLPPVFAGLMVAAQEPGDRYYGALRNNDIASLRTLPKGSHVNLRDNHGTTPLMYASTVGRRTLAPEDAR